MNSLFPLLILTLPTIIGLRGGVAYSLRLKRDES